MKFPRRIQQLAVGILAVLSLVVSSFAACACSHHEPVPAEEKSCHSSQHHDNDSRDVRSPGAEETCVCRQPFAERPVKSESFKLKKHTPGISVIPALSDPDLLLIGDEAPYARLEPLNKEITFLPSLSRGPPAS